MKRVSVAVALLLLGLPVRDLHAAESRPVSRVFEPPAIRRALYDVRAPWDAPDVQRTYVTAPDGVRLWVETWLPVKRAGGPAAPKRVPTVVIMTPYARRGWVHLTGTKAIDLLVPRGYAFSVMHVRGTGESGGCMTMGGSEEVLDGAAVVEYLGRDAPWANGVVGSIGLSYHGGTPILTAADGPREQTKYLKAMVLNAPYASSYAFTHFDGVPRYIHDSVWSEMAFEYGLFPSYVLVDGVGDPQGYVEARTSEGGVATPENALQRPPCFVENELNSLDRSGDFTAYWREREHRFHADRIKAPTLMVHGHVDENVWSFTQRGLFDRIEAPKAGLFGVFAHEWPDTHDSGIRTEWERADWPAMYLAWFDRWLMGVRNGADRWPVAQVQGTDGQWRAEPSWPTTGGPKGHLALGAEGALGATAPSGSSSYREGLPLADSSPVQEADDRVVFETPPVRDRLEITGQPVLDAWLTLDRPDAHVAVSLEVVDRDGNRVVAGYAIGVRSMRHLAPFWDGIFVQKEGRPAPVGKPFRARIRFNPTDLVVPPGGRLRLVVSDSRTTGPGFGDPFLQHPTEISGSATTVTVLHDCRHPSVLRFEMPRRNSVLLNVRERTETGPLRAAPATEAFVSDGGGMATAPICSPSTTR